MYETKKKYLGFDLSTQQLKAIVIDEDLKICNQVNVSFENDLSEYKTSSGVIRSEQDENEVSAPVNMWLKAIDLCIEKLRIDGLDVSDICCISGSAQQHGSVWWRSGSNELLTNLNPDDYLHKNLVSAFSLRNSPIWMDSSTKSECNSMEDYVGGPIEMTKITGSRAYERFTGPQIAKIYHKRPEVYNATERITLISNFLASVFIGEYAPFETSDASGMNMMDINKKRWSQVCLEAVVRGHKDDVQNLRAKLGCQSENDNIVDSHQILGPISSYFVQRFGFSTDCLIAPFTGDNPASMAGLRLSDDEILISLGTSDTACFSLNNPNPKINGHILRSPLDSQSFMGLVCQKNGSFTRNRIRSKYASGNHEEFDKLLHSVPRGNFGNIGFYFDDQEIWPCIKGDFRYNSSDQRVLSFSPEIEIRACIEGQFLRLHYNCELLGLDLSRVTKILVTGGGSANRDILQVLSDVFKLPCYTIDTPNTACLGGAYLARYAHIKRMSSSGNCESYLKCFKKIDDDDPSACRNLLKVADPTPIGSIDVYKSMSERVKKLIDLIVENN